MSRKRLSWDEEKVAELTKTADPYTMNQDHKNPPVEKYRTGDPSAWAEDPHMATPWKNEGRTETGHPAPARQAVAAARKMEDKAIKCITVAQRMLPGASDEVIEEQATDLMYLPENAVMATLTRQSSLAESMVEAGDDEDDDDENGNGNGEKEEKEEKAATEEVEAKKEEKMPEEKEDPKKEATEEVEAKKGDMSPDEGKEAPAGDAGEAAKEEEKAEKPVKAEEEGEKEAKAEEKPAEEEKPAKKEADLLDVLFDNAETTEPEVKTGAKKLSGMVRQASGAGASDLTGIWKTPPDVSKVFRS